MIGSSSRGCHHCLFSTVMQTTNNNNSNKDREISDEDDQLYKVKVLLTSADRPIVDDISQTRLEYCSKAKDAATSAGIEARLYYDTRHTPLLLNLGDKAYLLLNHGYQLPGKPNRKQSPQRCVPFSVKHRVGRLAYGLELPENWIIHPVISLPSWNRTYRSATWGKCFLTSKNVRICSEKHKAHPN